MIRPMVLVALSLALVGQMAVARAEMLDEALVDAYLNNAELAEARAEVRAVDELVPQALALYRPDVFFDAAVEGSRSNAEAQGAGESTERGRTTRSVALSLNQNLYSGGGRAATTARAENLVRAQRAVLSAVEQAVLLDAVEAYTATWRDRAVLDLALNNEERLRRQLQATRDRFEVGEVARTDVAQAEARLAGARADVEAAKSNLATSSAAFERVIGRPPGTVDRPEVASGLPSSLEEARALAKDNPNLIAANFNLSAAQDDVDIAYADLLPSVDLSAQVDYAEEPSVSTEFSESATVGVSLSIPLYQGGSVYSRVREQRQVVRQRQHGLEDTHREVREAVTAAWEVFLASTAEIESFESEVRANRVALEGVQEEALVGARTVLDVLDAEQELFTAQVDLVRAERDEVVASYDLKSAIGELTVAELGLDVIPYDDDRYYELVRNRLFGLDIEDY